MEPSDSQASCINWDAALEATGDDAELLDELVGVFMEEGPMLIQQMHQGLETKDATLVRRAAHTLKGSLRIFQASRGAELAFQIEKLGQENDMGSAPAVLKDLEAFMERMTVELKDHLKQ